MTNISALITKGKDGWWELKGQVTPEFMGKLRSAIPKKEFWYYDPKLKLWRVAPQYLKQLHSCAKKTFDAVFCHKDVEKALGKQEVKPKIRNPYAMMYLTDEVPLWLAEKVYKLLLFDKRSGFRHEDRGGKADTSGRLNEAIALIREAKTE